jgi:energy-coupling factor transporter ATP-binding protein EcfA2
MTSPASPRPTPPRSGTLIIGPSGSGKTSLLATLETAATLACENDPGRYAVFPGNAAMQQLSSRARQVADTGQMDLHVNATGKTETYEAILRYNEPSGARAESIRPGLRSLLSPTLPPSRVRVSTPQPPRALGPETQDYRISLVDGPGGAIFFRAADSDPGPVFGESDADEMQQYRKELVDRGKVSDGLVICLDARNRESARDFFINLPQILFEMASDNTLRFSRVAITLTKADQVQQPGPGADQRLAALDPWDTAARLLGAFGIADFLKYLRPEARPRVRCGWSSVYGFIPGDGSPNFDPKTGKMLSWREDDPEFIHTWRPFRVLDPFMYVATGNAMGMAPIPPKWLPR